MIARYSKNGIRGESNGVGLLIVLGIVALIFARSLMSCSPGSSTASVGSDVVLRLSNGSGDIVLCTNESAYDEYVKLAVAKDYLGMAKMESRGRLFRVPSGTKARVIDIGFEKREVRVMEGEHFGQSGWATSSIAQ